MSTMRDQAPPTTAPDTEELDAAVEAPAGQDRD